MRSWFYKILELLTSVKNSRRKRRGTGEDNLLAAIEVYEEKIGTISVETFLKHLSYQCTSCQDSKWIYY